MLLWVHLATDGEEMKIWTPAQQSKFFVGMDVAYAPYSFPVEYSAEEEQEAVVNLFGQLLQYEENDG